MSEFQKLANSAIFCMLALVSVGFVFTGASPGHCTDPKHLFRVVEDMNSELSASQLKMVDTIRIAPGSADLIVVRFQQAALEKNDGETIVVPLNGKTSLSLKGYKITSSGKDSTRFSWKGKAMNENLTLSIHDDFVTGLIYSGGKVYSVEPLGKGFHAMVQVDQTRFSKDKDEEKK